MQGMFFVYKANEIEMESLLLAFISTLDRRHGRKSKKIHHTAQTPLINIS